MTGPIGVVGKSGQVARALVRLAKQRGDNLIARGRPDLDLTDPNSINAFLEDAKPALIANAAAFTAVDKAESQRDDAFNLNSHGPGALAQACAARNIPLIHISTDYVFDGQKPTPYSETELRKPLGIYGASKAAGEVAIEATTKRYVILRTAWVYSIEGANFVHTMLRLGAERDELGIVGDQHGTPTFADDIAAAILDIAPKLIDEPTDSKLWGTYHLTGGGETTWYGFAEEIFRHAKAQGLKTPHLKAITTADYPTPARRPNNSVLDCSKIETTFGIKPAPWQETLKRAIEPILAHHKTQSSQ